MCFCARECYHFDFIVYNRFILYKYGCIMCYGMCCAWMHAYFVLVIALSNITHLNCIEIFFCLTKPKWECVRLLNKFGSLIFGDKWYNSNSSHANGNFLFSSANAICTKKYFSFFFCHFEGYISCGNVDAITYDIRKIVCFFIFNWMRRTFH